MKYFLLFSICILPLIGFAQPDTLWTRIYGGSGDEYASGLIALESGDYVVSATSNSFGSGGMDFYALRVTGSGDTVWTHTFGSAGDDWCNGVAQLSTGVIILAGYGLNSAANRQAIRHAEYFANGDYRGSSDEWLNGQDLLGYAVAANTDGRSAVAGRASANDTTGRVLVLSYLNGAPHGFAVFLQIGAYCQARAIAATSDGGYIVAGSVRATVSTPDDFLLIRLNSSGDTLWTRTYGGTGEDIANSVVQTHDGGFALTGPSDSYGVGGDVVLLKTDSLGNLQWLHTFGGDGEEHGHVVLATQDGGYFLAGHTTSFGLNGDVYAVRTDSAGNLRWSRSWGGDGLDVAESAVELADGGFLVAGETQSFGAGGSDIWLLRIAPDLSTGEQNTAVANGPALSQNYPNPFNSATRIFFDVPHSGHALLTVFDILGRNRATLFDAVTATGRQEVVFDASGLSSGVYFYRLDLPGESLTKQMTVLK